MLLLLLVLLPQHVVIALGFIYKKTPAGIDPR
jgi:hypothetical protein